MWRREHRHIVEIGLALLAKASMLVHFWDEASLITCYLINRLPSRVIGNSTLIKHLFTKNPDHSLLRAFRCAHWPNLRPYNTIKLDFDLPCVSSLAIAVNTRDTNASIVQQVGFIFLKMSCLMSISFLSLKTRSSC